MARRGLQIDGRDGHRVAASIMIYDADEMTPEGRKQVAAWMRKQAKFLEEHGAELQKAYRARYLYRERTATKTD